MTEPKPPDIWLRSSPDAPELGPFRLSQVRQMAAGGLIARTFQIRQGDSGQWHSVTRVKGLLPESAAQQLQPDASLGRSNLSAEDPSLGRSAPQQTLASGATVSKSQSVSPSAIAAAPRQWRLPGSAPWIQVANARISAHPGAFKLLIAIAAVAILVALLAGLIVDTSKLR